MKVGARANKKIIEYAQTLIDAGQLDENSFQWAGKKLPANASWESCFEVIISGYSIGVETGRDDTILTLYRNTEEGRDDIVNTHTIPNEIVYTGDGDWEWNYIYKYFCELFIKNKKKRKKITISDTSDLTRELEELKQEISKSIGTKKKRLIEEYNAKYRLLEAHGEPENNTEEQISIEELRKQRSNLRQRINYAKKKGNPYESLEKELEKILLEIDLRKK